MAPIQPYAQQHRALQGPGDQRPRADQVVQDYGLIGALPNANILITGCTAGIGVETARALYLTGARIWITVRDLERGHAVAAELSTDPARPVKVIDMSLDSFTSVRAAAADFLSQASTLNILINNAGVMACPESKTEEGHEMQFGANHLGHFLLFQLLKPALLAAATPERPSRVVSVSSAAHRLIPSLPFDDVDFSKTAYSPFAAYARSKLANIYFANELSRRHACQHLHALSLHPGSIATTLQRFVKATPEYRQAHADPGYLAQVKDAQQGAATSVWAAVGAEWLHRGGVYLDNVARRITDRDTAMQLTGLRTRAGSGRTAPVPALMIEPYGPSHVLLSGCRDPSRGSILPQSKKSLSGSATGAFSKC